jgi:hypothetical protein
MEDLIKGLLKILDETFGDKQSIYATESDQPSEYKELISLQPTYKISQSIDRVAIEEDFNSYEEFERDYGRTLRDRYYRELNQVIYWSIISDIEELDGDEEPEFTLLLVILHPRKNVIKTVSVKIEATDLPKIKEMLRDVALFNFYNFSQAFK